MSHEIYSLVSRYYILQEVGNHVSAHPSLLFLALSDTNPTAACCLVLRIVFFNERLGACHAEVVGTCCPELG